MVQAGLTLEGEEVTLWLLISLLATIKPQINEMKQYRRYFP
jgi:hypothetical protein